MPVTLHLNPAKLYCKMKRHPVYNVWGRLKFSMKIHRPKGCSMKE
jgi:hypothetical protein